jgi:acetylornithine deacetylase/succinyl-diaminopimelate desuccinylase-like protein
LEKANKAFAEAGIPTLTRRHKFGGSDAAYITAAGIPCLDSLGVTGGAGHTKDEFAYIASLPLSAKMLALAAIYL